MTHALLWITVASSAGPTSAAPGSAWPGRRLSQPTDVLQQHGPLEIQLTDPRAGDEPGGGAQVAVRDREQAKLLADRSVTHQQIRQRAVEMMPARDPACFVE